MKLATIAVPDTSDPWDRRDGRLVIVDDDAGRVAHVPDDVAPALFAAFQDWSAIAPKLDALARRLRAGDTDGLTVQAIGDVTFMAPLPRTTCWIDGSAYIQHIVLVRKARNADPPETLRTVPLMYQGAADPLYGPTEDVVVASEDYGIDFESEVYVVLDDVPMGTTAADAGQYIKLVGILNDVSLRNLIPAELKAGFGFFHGKPPSHLAPYVVTPDELGDAWQDHRVHLPLHTYLNGEQFGDPDAGDEMFFGFHQLIEHAAKTRPLPGGTILGSGTVSNADTARGCSCLAEKRMLEIINDGEATTPFMRFGDHVKIEMLDKAGKSIFGAIDHKITQYDGP